MSNTENKISENRKEEALKELLELEEQIHEQSELLGTLRNKFDELSAELLSLQ